MRKNDDTGQKLAIATPEVLGEGGNEPTKTEP